MKFIFKIFPLWVELPLSLSMGVALWEESEKAMGGGAKSILQPPQTQCEVQGFSTIGCVCFRRQGDDHSYPSSQGSVQVLTQQKASQGLLPVSPGPTVPAVPLPPSLWP